jgi:hypothetical protein
LEVDCHRQEGIQSQVVRGAGSGPCRWDTDVRDVLKWVRLLIG